MKLARDWVDVPSLLSDVIDLYQYVAEEKKIRVTLVPAINARPTWMPIA